MSGGQDGGRSAPVHTTPAGPSRPAGVRVVLPAHLKKLAGVTGEVLIEVDDPVTVGSLLDALESRHPVLRGTIRDHDSQKRRPFVRFFACEEDLSNDPADAPLPQQVIEGGEPFFVIGAIAGG